MSDKIRITVDGQPTEVEPGTMLLTAMQRMGVNVPTLCHHESVEPSGACRLCTVEISHADWGGWTGLVTSCLYPVADDGLQVSTRSERVRATRATLMELYLSRCPDSPEIAAMARAEGIDVSTFEPTAETDRCIQCGLCVRVCKERAVAALAPLGRGTAKTVGPRPDYEGEDCVGCLACSHICPTGHITTSMSGGRMQIWNRDFDVALCSVDREKCRACGACEEACPLAIPRVSPNAAGEYAATISHETCVGCGLCVGACPTGAISQKGAVEIPADLTGKAVVFACSRSALPEGVELIPVSCIGSVGIGDMLECLARGATGVQLMCRDADTCPYGAGGYEGRKRAMLSNRLAAVSGLGMGRIEWTHPASGQDGPAEAAALFEVGLGESPLEAPIETETKATGLDRAMEILDWLRERPELAAGRAEKRIPLPGASNDPNADNVFYIGGLPELALLTRYVGAGADLVNLLRAAAQAMVGRRVSFRVVTTREEVAKSMADCVIVLSKDMLPDPLPGSPPVVTITEVCDLDTIQRDIPAAMAEILGPGFRFEITPDERRRLVELLADAPDTITCDSPYELLQIELLKKTGSWQQALCATPTMAFENYIAEKAREGR